MRGKSLTCRRASNLFVGSLTPPTLMRPSITIDPPALFITAVAKDRLPVFRTDAIKMITCAAIDEARTSAGFLLFAYVLMPDHMHVLTDNPHKPSKVLQFIKGIVGHRVIRYLKESERAPI